VVDEAPQDIAALLNELASVYQSVYATYGNIDAAVKATMETTFSMHRDAHGSLPYSWKREASFRELTENRAERIAKVQASRKALSRRTDRPDQQMARRVNRIESRLDHALPPVPKRSVIDQAMAQQQTIIKQIQALAESLEVLQ